MLVLKSDQGFDIFFGVGVALALSFLIILIFKVHPPLFKYILREIIHTNVDKQCCRILLRTSGGC